MGGWGGGGGSELNGQCPFEIILFLDVVPYSPLFYALSVTQSGTSLCYTPWPLEKILLNLSFYTCPTIPSFYKDNFFNVIINVFFKTRIAFAFTCQLGIFLDE